MMKLYYIIVNNQKEGPFSLDQLKSLKLEENTPVWHDKHEEWITIRELNELKEILNAEKLKPQNIDSTKISNDKKRIKISIVFLILLFILLVSVIVWLIYQNSNQSENINSIEETMNTQQSFIESKNIEEEKRNRINQEITRKNMNYRNNWMQYIQLSTESPKVNYTLGGISEFTVSISNNTTYLLDEISVEIQYIRKNGDIYQVKTINLFNIPANSTGSEIAPSSLNGVKINCNIVKIVSKKMHFCYPIDNGNSEDPYFCK